jgi:hypothetical protein
MSAVADADTISKGPYELALALLAMPPRFRTIKASRGGKAVLSYFYDIANSQSIIADQGGCCG